MTIREVLEKLYYAPRMDDLNPVGWKDAQIELALAEIEGIVVPEVRDIKAVLFALYPASYGDDGECQLRTRSPFEWIDGNKIAQAIHAMLKERVK